MMCKPIARECDVIEIGLAEELAFVVAHRNEDESMVLAQVVREGIHKLYQETLIQAYLLGQVSRELVLQTIGQAQLTEIEYQRAMLQRDIAWAMQRD